MTAALLVPSAVSLLVLAAHFLRGGHVFLVAITLSAGALLVVKRPWAARALQLFLAIGAAEWIRTLLGLIAERQAEERPFVRMAVILGAVAASSLLGAAAMESRPLRTRYNL